MRNLFQATSDEAQRAVAEVKAQSTLDKGGIERTEERRRTEVEWGRRAGEKEANGRQAEGGGGGEATIAKARSALGNEVGEGVTRTRDGFHKRIVCS